MTHGLIRAYGKYIAINPEKLTREANCRATRRLNAIRAKLWTREMTPAERDQFLLFGGM
jgi:hypothetical protein